MHSAIVTITIMVASPDSESMLPTPQENEVVKLDCDSESATSNLKAADARMDASGNTASLVQQALGTCGQDNSRFLRAVRERLRR